MLITASLVLFHNDPILYSRAIHSFLEGTDGLLYVVDNSSSPLQHSCLRHPRVKYIFAGKNLGFGAGHNKAMLLLPHDSELHLLLNPDISFDPDVVPHLKAVLLKKNDIGVVMPKIIYPNGDLQRLCKLMPSPLDLFFRRFVPLAAVRDLINKRYELHDLNHDQCSDIPSLSGCFLLVRTELLRRLGGFDERYFMYMEDVDLVRRIGDIARTVYCPSVSVVHAYAKGSYKNKKLLKYHLISAIAYFNKWGWFFDPIRSARNSLTIKSIRELDR